MRSSIFILIFSTVMLGCSNIAKNNVNQTSTLVSTLKSVDINQQPSFTQEKLDQYKISGFSMGSWVNQKPGQYFKLVKPQHENAAVIYLYRPDSNWNRQEIIAPSFFLNDKKIPSLISNHYYWIELAEGDYKLSISRPLTVLYFQKPLVAHLSVKAGKQYFIKYEEEQFRGGPNGSEDLLRVGPLMQMPTQQALKEIGTTQLKSSGLNYVAEILEDGQIVKSKKKIDSGKYKASDDVHLKQAFKIWNPLTW